MNKKKIYLSAIGIVILIFIVMNLWSSSNTIPEGFDKELWSTSKKINNLILKGLKDFVDFKVVKNHDRESIGEVDDNIYLISSKTQKDLSKLLKVYSEIIENNKYKLKEKEVVIYYHTLENLKLYYKLDYLIKFYNISCLEGYIGEEEHWDEDLFLQRQGMVLVLEAIKSHGNSLEKYYGYSYSEVVERIKDKILSLE